MRRRRWPVSAGGRAALAGTGFFRLWTAESVSLAGAQVTAFAIPLVAVLTLDAGPWQMGLLGAAGSLSALLFGLPVGVWADRYERRRLMLLANAVRAAALLAVPVLYLLGSLGLPALVLVAFTVGTFSLLFDSAMSSYLPRLVGRAALGPANSWLQGTQAVGEVGGPGLAGLLVQVAGAPLTLLFDSASYLVSSVALASLPRAAPEGSGARDSTHLKAVRAGLAMLWRNRILRPLVLSAAHFNLFTSMFFALYTLYAIRVLQLSPFLLGLCTMLGGVGGLAAAAVTGWLGRAFGMGPVLIACYAVPGLAGLLVPAAGWFGRPVAAVLLAGSTFIWSACVVVLLVMEATIMQSMVEDGYLGRTRATIRFISWGIEPFGALAGGALGSAAGLGPTMTLAAAGVTLSALWSLRSDVRSLSGLEPPAAASPDGAPPDGALPDGAPSDAARPDAAPPDAARPDGARPDGGAADGGAADGGAADGGAADGGAGNVGARPHGVAGNVGPRADAGTGRGLAR